MGSNVEKRSGKDRRVAERRKHERFELGFTDRRKGERRSSDRRQGDND